jgi:hypothetical protein
MSIKIKDEDYPCCYLDSNLASISAQRNYKALIYSSLGVMLLSTILSSIPIDGCPIYNKINGVVLLLSSFISIGLIVFKPEKNWYIGRAVSESIKTLTWRYMMKSKPFDIGNEDEIKKTFIDRCSDVTIAAIQNGKFEPSNNSFHQDFITQKMDNIRSLTLLERKGIYASERIEEQITWYKSKSIKSKNKNLLFTLLLGSCQFLAAIYLIFLFDLVNCVDVNTILIFIAASCISIIEMNKFGELAQSYSFTAFELNKIRNHFNVINSEMDLDNFVEIAEQAISREHTMWLARRSDF